MVDYIGRRYVACLFVLVAASFSGCSGNPGSQNANVAPAATSNVNANASGTVQPPQQADAPHGYVDDVKWVDKAGGTIAVKGWAADVQDGSPVKKVEVMIGDKVVGEATLAKDRPDVVKAFSRTDWQRSGWEATVSVNDIAPGKHTVTAVAYDSAGSKRTLGSPRDLDLKPK